MDKARKETRIEVEDSIKKKADKLKREESKERKPRREKKGTGGKKE